MCAATRSSLGSADWVPSMSMPVIVAENVIAVIAAFKSNVAKPNELLGAPVAVVGFVGGTSAALLSTAVNRVSAFALAPAIRIPKVTGRIERRVSMSGLYQAKMQSNCYDFFRTCKSKLLNRGVRLHKYIAATAGGFASISRLC